MIRFDSKKLYVEHVFLKSVTTALGGSIHVVDDEASTDEKEVYKKIKAPMAVVRKFVEDNKKVSRYLKPVLTAVTYYGNHVVALERHPYNRHDDNAVENLFGELAHWTSDSERNLDKYVRPLTGDWYIDGTFIYTFGQKDLDEAQMISGDGRFKSVAVRAYKLGAIHQAEKMNHQEDRTCLLYTAANGQTAMSPPIWKQLSGVGEKALGLTEDEDGDGAAHADALGVVTGRHQFDRINDTLAVNLAFALTAGKKIADVFGYDAIEALGLDELMIQLRTVNLPRVAKEVKQTFDIGMPFTHAVAWLLGLTTRTETLDGYIVLRSLMKYLTTKGIYRKNSFLPSAVYRPEKNQDHVPTMTIQEAYERTQERLRKLGARPVCGWASKEALASLETGE